MTSEHPPQHEELLRAVRAGERDPAEAEFQAQLASCAQCAARWRALEDVAKRLSAVARAQRHGLTAAAARPPGPGEERIEATLARLAREEPLHAPRRFRARAWLVAAALLLAGSLAWRALVHAPERPLPDVPLGASGLRLLEPLGEVHRSDLRFRWQDENQAPSYDLRISPFDEPDVTLLELRVYAREWIPGPEQSASFPRHFVWSVTARDDAGGGDSASSSAELLP